MMKAIVPITSAVFNIPLITRQIRNFRAAVHEVFFSLEDVFKKEGIDAGMFLNRDPETGFKKNLFRYPLIQFQNIRHEGRFMAAVTGIGKGVAAVDLLLRYKPATIRFDGRKHEFTLLHETRKEHEIMRTEEPLEYRIHYWVPLNPENYRAWKEAPSLKERAELLDNCLHGHVMNFLRAMHFDPGDTGTGCRLQEIDRMHRNVRMHGRDVVCITALFSCNVSLPGNIGLGQAPSHGFGKIRPVGRNP